MTKKVLFLSGSLLVVLLIALGTIPTTVSALSDVVPPEPDPVDNPEPEKEPMKPAPPPPDDRLNKQNGLCAVFADEDGIRIYGFDSVGEGILQAHVGSTEISGGPGLLHGNEAGTMGIYQLAGGGFQANCGPDADGKVFITTFDAAPPTTVCGYEYNINTPDIVTQTMECGPPLMERWGW